MKLELNPNATARFFTVGDWAAPVLVIDDYLLHAERVREYALSLSYGTGADSYPGVTAQATLAGATEATREIAERMIGQLFETRPPYLSTAGFGNTICRFSAMTGDRGKLPQNFVDQHADSGHRWLAAVLHLSHETEGRGTGLWQHRPSGMQSWFTGDVFQIRLLESLNIGLEITAQFDSAMAQVPVRSAEELSRLLFRPAAGRRPFSAQEDAEWRLLTLVEAGFNRLVVYPTWQIHSIVDESTHADLSADNVRLTMNMYVDYPFHPDLGFATHKPRYPASFYSAVAGLATC